MSKFFNRPQLGQAQLNSAQQTTLTGRDQGAQAKAEQAARSIDMLAGMTQQVISSVGGAYQRNMEEKNKMASANLRGDFLKHVESEIQNTEDFEYIGDDGLKQKYLDYSESFMEKHKDKPYSHQLKRDIERYAANVIPDLYSKRDAISTERVSNYTSQVGLDNATMYSQGQMSPEAFIRQAAETIESATEALQTPSSSSVPLSDEQREQGYKGLLRGDARQAFLKGVAISLANPENSKLAEVVQSKEFMDVLGVNETDVDYQKLVDVAIRKGQKADKVNYETSLESFNEALYAQTNQGLSVDIDLAVTRYKEAGNPLKPSDEHKLRKHFKQQNDILDNSGAYRQKIAKGVDITIGMQPKDKEAVLNRVFTDELGITGSEFSIGSINGALSTKEGQVAFADYTRDGGELPKSVSKLFDMPAGAGVEKWNEAEQTLVTMQASMTGSGKSVDQLIGVDKVARIRAFSNMLNDKSLSEQDKREQRILLSNSFANINSRGFVKPMDGSTIDQEAIMKKAKDAEWTTDNLVGYRQNAEVIAHYASLNELAGMNGEDAVEQAINQFDMGHVQFEAPDGGEIAVPVEHRLLNKAGIEMFARGNADIASRIEESNMVLFGEYRVDRQIGIRKAPDFNRSKEYMLTYDGKNVNAGRFTYEQYESYIGQLPRDKQREVNKDLHQTRQEKIEESLSKRAKRAKAKGSDEEQQFDYGQFSINFK